ncbi:MAG: coenzyme F420-0:L-glutamate ligase [Candidatus Dormibacteraeota bacterium]|nr:coenzyme F420-0:L-glutamate ligase [Candidatus Dormibacteraeota bacterium]
MKLQAWGVEGLPEVRTGDDVAAMIAGRTQLRDGDVLVVAQKVVSKAEGRLRDLRSVRPSQRALDYAARLVEDDPRVIQLILDESVRVVRDDRVLIVETRHGFVCANAGIDHSNVEADETVVLLPEDPDASAARLRERLREVAGCALGVIVSDTFGRPWRMGIANVALGVAGVASLIDHRGRPDDFGRTMSATVIAVADEMAATAELVMGKTCRVPAVVLRGWTAEAPPGTGSELVRPAELDLFR